MSNSRVISCSACVQVFPSMCLEFCFQSAETSWKISVRSFPPAAGGCWYYGNIKYPFNREALCIWFLFSGSSSDLMMVECFEGVEQLQEDFQLR